MPALRLFAVLTCLLLQTATSFGQSAGAIEWQSDLDAARATAERENKLLLVHFYTDSCGPCRVLDATVFNQPSVASTVQANYVPVKLNASEFPATAQRFGITRVPTDVMITPKGQVIDRVVSPTTPMAYITRMSSVAEKHKQAAGRNFQVASQGSGLSQPVNSAYAALAVPTDSPNTAAQPTLSQNTASPAAQATVPAAVTLNPYANAAPAEQPAVAATSQPTPPVAAVANSRYADQPITPIQPDQQVENQIAATTPQAPSSPAAGVQLPANSPPVGFFGYCPVTMKKENRWQKGNSEWGAYHRGRTYLFASAEYRDEFIKDATSADSFAPALSGIDPVAAIDNREMKPGLQQFGVEYNGMFYLFSSEENLRKFWSQANRYSSGVKQAMQSAPAGRIMR